MRKNDLQSKVNRFLSFFSSSKADKNDDNLSTKTGGARMERRADITDTSEFDDYLERAPTKEVGRLKSKKGATSRTVIHNSVNMELIQKCYRNIPERYFSEGSPEQIIDAQLFRRDRRKLEDAQDKIAGHLDEIELCLFNQVTSRFDEFVSVLMAIESLDLLVKENLNRLAILRKSNQKHKKRFGAQAQKVCDLQLKLDNMNKVHELLIGMKKVQTANEYIRANILRDKDSCTGLIQWMRQGRPRMTQLICLSEDYDSNIEECEFLIKKDFTESFNEAVFEYVTGATQYKQEFWSKLAGYHDLLEDDQLDVSNTTVVLDEQIIYEEKNSNDPAAQKAILDIVLGGWRSGQLAVDSTKGRLAMFQNKLFAQFTADMLLFCKETLKARSIPVPQDDSLSSILSKMSLEFFVKVVEYYSSLNMKYLRRMLSMGRVLIDELLVLTTSTEQELRPHLHNLIEGIFNVQLATVKLVLQKVVELLNQRKLACSMDFYRFRNYIRLFEIWEHFFAGEAAQQIKYSIPFECTCKDRVYVLKSKLNGHFITNSKAEVLLNFLGVLHKNVMTTELKKEMDNDTWQAEDIPTNFYETFSYLIAGDNWNNRRNVQTTVLESSIFFDRSFVRRNADKSSSFRPDETAEVERRVNIRIIKNECVIEGRSYKLSKAFLYLLELLEEYVRLAEAFPLLQEEVGIKICEVVQYYNKYAYQLIIGAKAVALGRIKNKNITARHLCVCSLCVEMLTMLLRKISERIKITDLNKTIESLTNHHNEIVKKLKSILMARVTASLDQIDLQKVPCKGTEGIVTSAKTLYDIAQDYLTPESIRRIFDADLFSAYNERLRKLPIQNLMQGEILKEDMNFYFNELRMLDSFVPEYWQLRQAADTIVVQAFESL